ncbi:MAG TPA: TIGR01212 family radical SAM protein [Peptococcaceae bacterium]|nr:TIGR01212 family radical SAM protein [Peptococcaceae bacterium]
MKEKRYTTLNEYLRKIFGEKVIKVSLDAGLSCPNRDGTLSSGGCIFCSEKGSGDFAGDRSLTIKEQFAQVRARTIKKWPQAKYIAYFQSFSGTYGSAAYLRNLYLEALEQEGVVGLSISTRPDCLPEEILTVLDELNKKTYLWVELGLQSIHAKTLSWMNRGHDFQCFVDALQRLRQRNIRVCAHIILGLPCETRQEMLATAQKLAELPIQGVKIHSLHILKGTPLAYIYAREKFQLLTMEEYIELVADILEILPKDIIIHRLMGDGPSADVIAPRWTCRKWEVLNGIDREMARRGSYQGCRYRPSLHIKLR